MSCEHDMPDEFRMVITAYGRTACVFCEVRDLRSQLAAAQAERDEARARIERLRGAAIAARGAAEWDRDCADAVAALQPGDLAEAERARDQG